MSVMTASAPTTVPLGEVARFIRGVAFSPSDQVDGLSDGIVACMTTKNVQSHLDTEKLTFIPDAKIPREEQRLQVGDILVSTANSWNLVGKCCWVPQLEYPATAGAFISILRADPKRLDARYLFHWASSGPTQHALRLCGRKTTNISNLNFERAESLEIPLPPLPEQKRIAAILDRADGVVRKRASVHKLFNLLISSAFDSYFGDAVFNPKGWPRVDMGDLFSQSPNYGSMLVPNAEAGPDTWLDLRVANIQDGALSLADRRYIALDASDIDRHSLQDGDLLLARAIGSAEHLGKSALAFPGEQQWAFDSHVMRVRFDRARALPEYIHAFLNSKGGRHQFMKCTRKSAIQFNINTKEICRVETPLPPLEEQQAFVRFLHQQQSAVTLAERGVANAMRLSASLSKQLLTQSPLTSH
ncbi:MAG: restriction endonuclease subunit S [Phycisphaerales bacterium]|nr:restriction endonuclease subunit S [Phycisphaerales bacterium]